MNLKIRNDIKELVNEEVISQDVASNIEAYYLSKQVNAPNRLFAIFGVLGAALIGLGIILILAHNWDDFSRITKTTFAFLPLVIGQFFVGYSILKKKSAVWKEASGTFLFFTIGSSIALVSQIYNIPGNLSAFLLTWTLLGLPLVYLLKSNMLGVLHIVLTTYYAVEYGYSFGFNVHTPWLYFVLLVLVLPYYWMLLKYKIKANVTSIFNWLLPLSLTIVLGAFVKTEGNLGFLMYVVLFGFLYNIGKVPLFDNQKLRRNGYVIIGSLGTIYMLLMTSFEWLWDDVFKDDILYNSQEFYLVLSLIGLTFGILIYAHFKKWCVGVNLYRYIFIIFTFIFFMSMGNPIVSMALINVLLLTLGITAIKMGVDKMHFGILNYGFVIIALLIACRFFDSNMSFVIRGLLFVSGGTAFFLTNYLMLQKQKKIKTK